MPLPEKFVTYNVNSILLRECVFSFKLSYVLPMSIKQEMDGSNGLGGNGLDVFLQNYKLGKTLGIGSFGKVKIADIS